MVLIRDLYVSIAVFGVNFVDLAGPTEGEGLGEASVLPPPPPLL